ncbi:MAG: zinc-finger domain-containing protein [Gammaproteobacteria bacterium]|nr:zinc-finger domain-containing protein [Gammaproteobacteria bacterium]
MNSSIDEFQQKHVSFSVVEAKDLPFHCPPKEANKWNMHPKVFLKFDSEGKADCPYCGASYELA